MSGTRTIADASGLFQMFCNQRVSQTAIKGRFDSLVFDADQVVKSWDALGSVKRLPGDVDQVMLQE